MNSRNMIGKSLMVAAVTLCLVFAIPTIAQVQTQTTTTVRPSDKSSDNREW